MTKTSVIRSHIAPFFVGFAISWLLFRTPEWACGPFRAEKSAEWAGAFASFAATGVALLFGLRETIRRRHDSQSRSQLAAVMLWPLLRNYSASLRRLSETKIVTGNGPLTEQDRLAVTRAYGSLAGDDAEIVSLGRDLAGVRPTQLARALSNARHAVRHTKDLLVYDQDLPDPERVGKQKAIKKAIKDARDELIPLIKHSYAVIGRSKKI